MKEKQVSRFKLAVYHPHNGWGGAEAVAFWTIQALINTFNVDLITFDNVNFAEIDVFYGTCLQNSGCRVVILPLPPFLSLLHRKRKGGLLLHYWAMRCLKRLRQQYDLIISTYNEFDVGQLAVQYIHFPSLAEFQLKALGLLEQPTRWYYRYHFFRYCYHKLGRLISCYSENAMRKNITLTNSFWTKTVIEKVYGLTARVIYPPVHTSFPPVPWEKRETGFVCVGRISPEKRIESIINILSQVRKAGFNIHLHIVGPISDHRYATQVLQLLHKHDEWIEFTGKLTRQEFAKMLATHRYGIHAMKNEHFGIAIAEMLKAGLIVFVPNSGGPVEIVNHESLVYEDERDAIDKIINILRDDRLQTSLKEHLEKQAMLFSEQHFMEEIKKLICEIITT